VMVETKKAGMAALRFLSGYVIHSSVYRCRWKHFYRFYRRNKMEQKILRDCRSW